jgi:hypothetical protein
MNARVQAMSRNRSHLVTLAATQYTVTDDRDGDGTVNTGDVQVLQKSLKNQMTWSTAADTQINFSTKGISSDDKTICVYSSAGPAYDCIVITSTRINMGSIINQGNPCAENNCNAK